MESYLAPSGLRVHYSGQRDIEPDWRDVFERMAFLQHGVALGAGQTVLDVNAGIGLFTTQAAQLVGKAASLLPSLGAAEGRVVSCEPLPAIYQVLKQNVGEHADFATTAGRGSDVAKVTLLPVGLGDGTRTEAEATYYAQVPSLSSFYPDQRATEEALLQLMGREGGLDCPGWLGLLRPCSPLLYGMLARWYIRSSVMKSPERLTCTLSSVSAVMEQEGLTRIDLLRVSAQRSELDVLHGIKDADWPKIRQAVVEVGSPERLPAVRAVLAAGQFAAVKEVAFAEGTRLYCTR